MKKTTTSDIARIAGVSPSAVSIALNGRPGISTKTRTHILEIAKKTNYYRNAPGRLRATNANIAILSRDEFPLQDRLSYMDLNPSVLSACEKLSYHVFMASTFYNNGELCFSDVLNSGVLDGILSYGDINSSLLAEMKALNIPIVALDSSRLEVSGYSAVQVDYRHAAYAATKYLIDLGHRDIAFIGNDKLHDFNFLVFEGFQQATMESDIALNTNRIQLNVYNDDSFNICLDEALAGIRLPTALFCATDFYAMWALRRLHQKKLHVPNDISVISIDDIFSSRHLVPSLTTMAVDRQKMGELGIDLLQKAINGEPPQTVVLPQCKLMIRESTAPPRSDTDTE